MIALERVDELYGDPNILSDISACETDLAA